MNEINAKALLTAQLKTDVTNVEPLQGGHWSQCFAFRANDRDLVIRFGQHLEDFKKDQLAAQHASNDLPIPEVLEIGSTETGHFCVSKRAYGEMIDNLDEPKMQAIVPALLRALDALRNIDPWVEQTASWQDQLLSVDEENDRVFGWHDNMAQANRTEPYQKTLAYLKANLPTATHDHLIHNDLLHFNVLTADNRITAVIDWGNAVRGDFLYDLAMFSFYAPYFPAMKNIDWLTEAKKHYQKISLDVPDFEQRIRCCEAHLALSGMAYNAFKLNWEGFDWNADRIRERIT
ncbi:MAG: phosphotransferase family protein [Fimbriimonas sp.]